MQLVEAIDPVTQPEPEPFVTIDRFHDLGSANVAEGLLGAAGLEVRLRDEQTVGVNWMLAPAIGGVRLEVRESQAQLARDLLAAEDGQVARLGPPSGDAEEAAYRRRQTKRKRATGLVGLALVSPILLVLGAAALALIRNERRGPEPSKEGS